MEIQYYGANSLKITTKKSVIAVDPGSDLVSLKTDIKKANVVMVSQPSLSPDSASESFVIASPGEYEFEDFSVKGIAAQPHTASVGDKSATIYRFTAADIRVAIIGHVADKLSEEQLEELGIVDVVVVPVGGGGYTLDAVAAAGLVRTIEPKLVLPVHCSEDNLSYSVPQDSRDLFTKELGATVAEDTPDKLKIKTLPEQLTVQIISVNS